MDISDISLWLHLSLLPGLGAARLADLATAYSSDGQLDEDMLINLAGQLPRSPRQQVLQHLRQYNQYPDPRVEKWLSWSDQKSNRLLVLPSPDYPGMLKLLPDPPPVLFLQGNHEMLWQPQIAVVGSRNPSALGREQAFQFSRALSEGGFTVTSGLALGIDGAAHEGALNQLGSTIAVLGSGLNVIYPARHRNLASEIIEKGLLISEQPLETPPKAANFPRRNRIISGLSLGTLVVEASMRSGSLITARMALDQSREVFAIPGSLHNPQARGCHHLIKQGAKLVETTDDIFSELPQLIQLYQRVNSQVMPEESVQTVTENPESQAQHAPESSNTTTSHYLGQAIETQQVLDAVGYEATHTDQIVARTGLDVGEVQVQLMQLELMGLIRSERGGVLKVSG